MQKGLTSADCLIGIAAGGTTPYVRGGLQHARSIGALAIAMACVPTEQAPFPVTSIFACSQGLNC